MMNDDSIAKFYLANQHRSSKGKKKIWIKVVPARSEFTSTDMVKNMPTSFRQEIGKPWHKKHLVQNLVGSIITLNEIIILPITRHRNINSLNNYSAISEKTHNNTSRPFYPDPKDRNAFWFCNDDSVFAKNNSG